VLTALFLAVEIVGGIAANSLALLSDAGHMLIDVSALVLALIAQAQARRPRDQRRTYGYRRFEVLAALANGLLLLVVAGGILREAWARLDHPRQVREEMMLAIAAGGLVVNLIGLLLLYRDRRANLNLQAAFFHVAGDALGSVGAIAAALVIRLTGWMRADAVASALISILIVFGAIRLLRESLHYLLEGAPPDISVLAVEERLREFPGVLGIHDLHVWRISSGMDVLTAHVVLEDLVRWREIQTGLRESLRVHFGLVHATLQMEGREDLESLMHNEGNCDADS